MTERPDDTRKGNRRHSFLLKLGGAALLVALADLLFYRHRAGSTLGLFAFALLAIACALRPEMFRRAASLVALAAATLFTMVLAADPGPLVFLLFWLALTFAVLVPRTTRFDDGWRWTKRLLFHAFLVNFGPVRDFLITRKAKARRRQGGGLARLLAILALPLIGTIVFLALFAEANPLIRDALMRLDFGPLDETIALRAFFWAAIFIGMWSLLRPPRIALAPAAPGDDADFALPGVSIASVTLSLLAFNALFAVQNVLDIAFLWSGAALPGEMTLAEYAHRGAYPLIATALLAGLFVLVTLRPGSPTAASRPIRLLVTLWIAQNLLLVASTMLRTFDYIDAYSLTRLRIAALIWMVLVAIGLVLICYRLLRGKSGAWLINANLAAALLTLAVCSTVDLGRTAAAWNVRHAREVGGRGTHIDLCYLNQLGPSALLPLIELESRALPAPLRERVQWLRNRKMDELAAIQADWRGWTWRGARRLAVAEALVAERGLQRRRAEERRCDGTPFPPPPPPPSPPPLPAAVEEPAAPEEDTGTTGDSKPLTAPPER